MNVIKKTAKDGLAEALKESPRAAPESQLKATFIHDGAGNPAIWIENTGPDVTRLKVSVERNSVGTDTIKGFIRPRSGYGYGSTPLFELGDLASGGKVEVEPVFFPQHMPGPTPVRVEYFTSTGQKSPILEVSITEPPR